MGEQPAKKTVLVVGAGASTEFSLPLGADLLNQIDDLLQVEGGEMVHEEAQALANYLERAGQAALTHIQDAAEQIRRGIKVLDSIDLCLREASIDDFTRRLGKWAIAYLITKAERERSLLHVGRLKGDDDVPLTERKKTWIGKLFRVVADTPKFDDRLGRLGQVSIVTFNYDRIIERYVRLAFGQLLESGLATKAADALVVRHVYGDLAPIAFGSDFSPKPGWDAAKRINTFSEGARVGALSTALDLMNEADQLVFLGFAFRAENLDVIRPTADRSREIRGTCLGLSADDRRKAVDALRSFTSNKNIQLQDTTAFGLMEDYTPAFEWAN